MLKGRASTQEVFSLSNSDLVPGKYEGGLKLWEGALDLVKALCREVENGTLSFAAWMWSWSSWYVCMPEGCSCCTIPGFQCRFRMSLRSFQKRLKHRRQNLMLDQQFVTLWVIGVKCIKFSLLHLTTKRSRVEVSMAMTLF